MEDLKQLILNLGLTISLLASTIGGVVKYYVSRVLRGI